MVGTRPWADVLDHPTEALPVVPVGAEVGDFVLGDDGVDPGQHSFLGGDAFACDPDLVVYDERPDEPQNELQVPTVNVLRPCKKKWMTSV